MEEILEKRKYPIGKFQAKESYSQEEIEEFINKIEAAPSRIEEAYNKLKDGKLDIPYREGGWTARQVLHHISDSHLNAYIRTKWTLTEDTPLIKAYNEKSWAETPEIELNPEISIHVLKSLHRKWVALLRKLTPTDLQRSFIHPETKKHVRLDRVIATYAWHGEHHLAHLQLILEL